MLPQISKLEFNKSITENNAHLGTSFLFDFEKGDFIIKDGRLVKVHDIDALKVWIAKIIKTEKFRYKIYENIDYGITMENLIGKVLPKDFVESELKRTIKEALEKHPMIQSINNIKTEIDEDVITISLTVKLINSDIFDQEVKI